MGFASGDKSASAMGSMRPRTPTKAALAARAHALKRARVNQHQQMDMGRPAPAQQPAAAISWPPAANLEVATPATCAAAACLSAYGVFLWNVLVVVCVQRICLCLRNVSVHAWASATAAIHHTSRDISSIDMTTGICLLG